MVNVAEALIAGPSEDRQCHEPVVPQTVPELQWPIVVREMLGEFLGNYIVIVLHHRPHIVWGDHENIPGFVLHIGIDCLNLGFGVSVVIDGVRPFLQPFHHIRIVHWCIVIVHRDNESNIMLSRKQLLIFWEIFFELFGSISCRKLCNESHVWYIISGFGSLSSKRSNMAQIQEIPLCGLLTYINGNISPVGGRERDYLIRVCTSLLFISVFCISCA